MATPDATTCPPCTPGAEHTCSPDLQSISDADPTGQLWATAMADTLTGAHHAAGRARQAGRDRLDEATLATLLNHYLGALAKGHTDNLGDHSELGRQARTLIRRFHRYQDMILRFTTDLAIPWTNYADVRIMPMFG